MKAHWAGGCAALAITLIAVFGVQQFVISRPAWAGETATRANARPTVVLAASAQSETIDLGAGGITRVIRDPAGLPAAVAATRARLLDMAAKGNVKDFVAAMEKAGDKPNLTFAEVPSPEKFWEATFGPGKAVKALTIIHDLLNTAAVKAADGSYNWPYFGEVGFAKLTRSQQQEAAKFLGKSGYEEARRNGYSGWRLGIGAKGEWLDFLRGD